MLLKRLELQGFKSFADKTVLDFGQGATAVVGPNGSGKSNISDAIRWVMGEMSAKSLRGSNMQDVIFAGTESRGRLNFAEVSLVLDNSERIFPLEYDEVVVTRRVFRSGETAYRINGTNCRLKDIHELFMDTGVGRDGYSIIGQGNVAQILSTKAEDRRNLFEEAAGVSKYKYKKEEATRKLAQTEDNILRVTDITTELESQLGPLERQSEKARKYLTYYEEYKDLDVNMAMVTLNKNSIETKKVEEQNESVNSEIAQIREKESETEAKITRLYDDSKKKDEEQTEKNNSLIEAQGKIMECANAISLAENTLKNNEKMVIRIDGEIESITKRNEERKTEIEDCEKKCKEAEIALTEGVEELSKLQLDDRAVVAEQEVLNKEISDVRDKISEFSNKISSEKSKSEGIENLRSNYILRRETIKTQAEALSSDLENTKKEIEEAKEQIREKSEKLKKLEQMISAQNEKKHNESEKLRLLNSDLESLRIAFNSKSSKRRMLEDMENEYDGYAKSVKAVLKDENLKKLSIYGTVAGLVDVKKEYAVAIEIALGNALQNIIVETEEDAKAAINFLKSTNSGRATFLPISSIKGRNLENLNQIKGEPGYIGVASDLLTYNSRYSEIMKNLLGRVVVVDNIDNGIKMSRKFGYKFRVVTLSGDVLNSGGSMSGGSSNKTGGFLSRAAEIKTLKSEIIDLDSKIKKVNEETKKLESAIGLIDSQLSSYIPMQREYENEILRLESNVSHLTGSISAGADTESGFDSELAELEEKLSKSAEEFAQSLNQVRNAENEKKQAEEKLLSLQEKLENLALKREDANQDIINQNSKLSECRSVLDSARARMDNLKSEIENSEAELQNKKSDRENIIQSNEDFLKSIEDKKSETKELEALVATINSEIEKILEQKKIIVNSLQEIQNSNKEITDTLLKLQQELSRVEAKQVKLSMERENILNRLWEDYELTYSATQEIAKEPENIKEASERLAELKSKIKALGSINIDSIEEYKAVSERYKFLTEQKDDLEKSKINLNKIIESMEELMKEHFTEQFNAISESFSIVFRELFGGGKGKIYLQDPDNVLTTGIEIEVQLPGKGLQNINLYSGGEKSFIAIALLFSILRVKPSPFCILDEIDAALDDVNVSRFATYLKNYIDSSQFIVITHRRGTMEAANILYGVTMQEKGVSKLLSLQIDDVADEMAE